MKQTVKKILTEGIILLIVIGGLIWVSAKFFHFGKVEYTDNAQVRQHIVPVNCRVQGFIREIRFEEYKQVKKGDTLVIIEDTEFQLRLAQAEADYQNALIGKSAIGTSISTTQNNIAVTDATIEEAKVLMENAKSDYFRYKKLVADKAVTQQQFEAMETAYAAKNARYEMLVKQRKSTTLVGVEQNQHLEQQEANIKLAEAAVKLAKLNLSYTVITAPCDGVVGRKAIQNGQLIQPGQSLVSIVNANEVWVIANYKETQISNIKIGMPVEIKVDAVDNIEYQGVVTAISDATGAQFSLIPQDNSAGNFIKVEQRIPVKISISDTNKADDLLLLHSGMNVECNVKYGDYGNR